MLSGKVVNIRPMSVDDLELFYTWNISQEVMGEYLQAEMYNKESFIESMKSALSSKKTSFLMIENKEKEPIGMLSYNNSAASNISIDFGILIADTVQRGKGIGKESIILLVNYLFNSKNIARIQFMTRTDNEGMKSLGEKLGFSLEGVLRKYRFDHGEARDLCLYAMTRDDWKLLNLKID